MRFDDASSTRVEGSPSRRCLVFGLMAMAFYFSANVAAAAGEHQRSAASSADEDEYEDDEDDEDADDEYDECDVELTAGSSIRDLMVQCRRLRLDVSGCTEKNDLLRLLGIPVPRPVEVPVS